MLLLMFIIIILVICAFIFILCASSYEHEIMAITSLMLGLICFVLLFAGIIALLLKPINYRNFKIKYDVIKEQITSKDDLRDATFTQNIIQINEKILHCREFKENIWIGIFENEKICEMELLNKNE